MFARVKPILAMSVRAETLIQETCGGDFLGAVAGEDKATSSGTGKVKNGTQCQERHDQNNDAFPRGRADQVPLGESGRSKTAFQRCCWGPRDPCPSQVRMGKWVAQRD